MATEKKYPVSVVVRVVDKITGPMAAITAKLKGLTAPFEKLGKGFDKFSDAAGFPKLFAGFQGVGNAVKNVGNEAFALGAKLFALASVAGFALFSIVKGAVNAGDELAMLADRTKTSVDWFASMRYAAEQADVTQEQFNGGLEKFVKNLGEMKANGGSFLGFLNKVSPKLAEQVKGAKSTEAAFSIMTDAFVRLQDPAKLAALGAETFGKASGPALANFLHQGSAAIQKQQLDFLRLAGSQEEFARGSSDLDNAARDLETAFTGFRNTALTPLLPALTTLSKALTEFIVKNRDGITKWAQAAAAAITAWVQGGGIDRLVEGIQKLGAQISDFVEMIGGWKVALGALAVFMAGPLLAAIFAVIPAVVSLGVALLTTPVGWFLLAVGAIAGAAFLIYKNWEPIKAFFGDLWDGITTRAQAAWDFLKGLVEEIKGVLMPFGGPPGQHTSSRSFLSELLMPPGGPNSGAFGVAPESARPAVATDARVAVSFTNLPQGARVTQDRNGTQPVDLSLGYSMGAP